MRALRNYSVKFCHTLKFGTSASNVVQMIRNDPFAKLSFSLLVIVIGGTAALEVYKKFGKKRIALVSVLPPSFRHYSVNRESLVKCIDYKFQRANSADKGIPIVCLTGPAGCGKTQLLCQFSAHFIASHQHKWLGLRRTHPVVLYLDASSSDNLKLSVAVAMRALGLKEGRQLNADVSAMMDCLQAQEQPWLLMVDGCPEAMSTDSSLATLVKHLKQGSSKQGCAVLASRTHFATDVLGDVKISLPSRYESKHVI